MSKHSYTRLWVHVLFSTKNVNPLITPSLEQDLHSHLGSQLAELGCASALINGNIDHVHLLFRQIRNSRSQTLSNK